MSFHKRLKKKPHLKKLNRTKGKRFRKPVATFLGGHSKPVSARLRFRTLSIRAVRRSAASSFLVRHAPRKVGAYSYALFTTQRRRSFYNKQLYTTILKRIRIRFRATKRVRLGLRYRWRHRHHLHRRRLLRRRALRRIRLRQLRLVIKVPRHRHRTLRVNKGRLLQRASSLFFSRRLAAKPHPGRIRTHVVGQRSATCRTLRALRFLNFRTRRHRNLKLLWRAATTQITFQRHKRYRRFARKFQRGSSGRARRKPRWRKRALQIRRITRRRVTPRRRKKQTQRFFATRPRWYKFRPTRVNNGFRRSGVQRNARRGLKLRKTLVRRSEKPLFSFKNWLRQQQSLAFRLVRTPLPPCVQQRHALRKMLNRVRRQNSKACKITWRGPRPRGKRAFSGLFGRARWRAERRDKVLSKRFLHRRARNIQLVQSTDVEYYREMSAIYKRRRAVAHASIKHIRNSASNSPLTSRKLMAQRLRLKFARVAPLSGSRQLPKTAHSNQLAFRCGNTLVVRRPLVRVSGIARVSVLRTKRSKVSVTLQRLHSRWQPARNRYKMLLQRNLNSSALALGGAYPTPRRLPRYSPAAKRLQVINTLIPLTLSSSVPGVFANIMQFPVSSTPRPSTTANGVGRLHNSQLLGSLAVTFDGNAGYTYTPGARFAAIHAYRAQELRFYRRRARMRLPRTTLTRVRRRKGGHVLFARNSLKRPVTRVGQAALLLPPVSAFAPRTHLLASTRSTMLPRTFTATEKYLDDYPRFSKRKFSKANLKVIYAIRARTVRKARSRMIVSSYFRRGVLRRRFKGLRPVHRVLLPRPINTAFIPSSLAACSVSVRSSSLQTTWRRRSARLRTTLNPHGYLARVNLLTLLSTARGASSTARVSGLWHARSVRRMRLAERQLSCFAPQLRARTRRRSHPRSEGVPRIAQKRLSFKAKRARRLANYNRLLRGVPQIQYHDYGAHKLQFYTGSPGTVGYSRQRRVYRNHSRYARWWQPKKYQVPFSHPFSRRSLTAKLYRRHTLDRTTSVTRHEFGSMPAALRDITLTTKFPGRSIPWRNFRYRKPRNRTAPSVLRRWTCVPVRGKTRRTPLPISTDITIRQTARDLHELSRFSSRRFSWNSHRWLKLDSSESTRFFTALRGVPSSIWLSLQQRAHSASVLAKMQHQVLLKLRHWIRANPHPLSQQQIDTAVIFFVRCVEASNVAPLLAHDSIRSEAFLRRRSIKHTLSATQSSLPSLFNNLQFTSLGARENSLALKQWLHGAKSFTRQHRWGYSAPSRGRYSPNTAITFARQSTRFPATARQRGSFDSALQAFARKIGPSRLRRAAALRFKRPRPISAGDFKQEALATAATNGLSRRRRLARRLSFAAYLSTPWRELVNHRRSSGVLGSQVQSKKLKLRFMSLPIKLLATMARRSAEILTESRKHQLRAIRFSILRYALLRRRNERLYADLRRAMLQRRIPKDRLPKFGRLRYLKRVRLVRRLRRSRQGPLTKYNTPQNAWTLSHLSAVGFVYRNTPAHVISAVAPTGELLPSALSVAYNRRAFYGFSANINPRHKRRLQRRLQHDTRMRYRRFKKRRRYTPVNLLRDVRHWSEAKNSYNAGSLLLGKRAHYAVRFYKHLQQPVQDLRSYTAALYSHRLSVFTSKSASRVALARNGNSIGAVTRGFLLHQSSLTRPRRRFLLQRRSGLDRLRYRKPQLTNTTFPAASQARSHSIERLVAASSNVSSLANPLQFQRPISYTIKTEAERGRDLRSDIEQREGRYRLTAQYVESLTAFLPELINHLVSKKIKNHSYLGITAKNLIRNVYWSLRVYLNVDPFDVRFHLRDGNPSARLRLLEEVSALSLTQKTPQPARAQLRYRFQPSRLLLAASTSRFREDWLRATFPAKHALYQEDADEYSSFLLRTRDVRRLRLIGRGPHFWQTDKACVSLETQARQLLNLKYSRRRRRFETLLQTIRRTPQMEVSPLIAKPLNTPSFFSRAFSTQALGRDIASISQWVGRQKRFVSAGSWRTITPSYLAQARSRVMLRLDSRSRTGYLSAAASAVNSSLLDYRFNRSKSPRSRQYILRSPRKSFDGARRPSATVTRRCTTSSANFTNLVWTRRRRRTFYNSACVQPTTTSTPALRQYRHLNYFRRVQRTIPAAVLARAANARTGVIHFHAQFTPVPAPIFYTPHFDEILCNYKRARKYVRTSASYQTPWTLRPGYSMRTTSGLRFMQQYGTLPGVVRSTKGKKFAITKTSAASPNNGLYFESAAARHQMKDSYFATISGMYSRYRSRTPFDTHRSKLWNSLTLRWKKKYRVGRYWIRDTSYWLRDPWLSKIVGCDMSLRPDRYGGEIRARHQRVGEYVADVDDRGYDVPEKKAHFRERHELKPRTAQKDLEIIKTKTAIRRGGLIGGLARQRLQISKVARRKPSPSMWLANYEYNDVINEHKMQSSKTLKQRREEEAEQVKAYWERRAKNIPEDKPRRPALKHPSNLWLPDLIWKEVARRVRRFEWRESDQVFFRRGFRNAFRFYPNERSALPWLEPLMYTRSTYSTRLHEFRRRQYPHEQKKYKWLQRVRRTLYSVKNSKYLHYRRWRRLRMYNQRLHYSLFDFPDRNATRRHFKNVNQRSRPEISSFSSVMSRLVSRLDNVLLQLRIAPTIYWARIVASLGLIRVNGKVVKNPAQRFHPSDFLQPDWDRIVRFQHYFRPYLHRREAYQRRLRTSATTYPTNFSYHAGTRTFIYKHAPDESDLRRSNRISSSHFRWFKLDSV